MANNNGGKGEEKKVSAADIFGGKMAERTKKIHNEVRGKPVEVKDFSDLPPNIRGGVARLTTAKFGKYASGPNEGKGFFTIHKILHHYFLIDRFRVA